MYDYFNIAVYSMSPMLDSITIHSVIWSWFTHVLNCISIHSVICWSKRKISSLYFVNWLYSIFPGVSTNPDYKYLILNLVIEKSTWNRLQDSCQKHRLTGFNIPKRIYTQFYTIIPGWIIQKGVQVEVEIGTVPKGLK